jgi:hypothetical protein
MCTVLIHDILVIPQNSLVVRAYNAHLDILSYHYIHYLLPKTFTYLYYYIRTYPISKDPKFLMTSNFLPSFARTDSKIVLITFPSSMHTELENTLVVLFLRCVFLHSFPKMVTNVLSQQAPNTHLWLIPSHLVLLLHFLQCHNELLKSLLCSCNLFLFLHFLHQNFVCHVYTIIGFLNLFALSCTACFTMPCDATSYFVTLKASSCSGSNFCAIFYCSVLI